MGSCEDDNEVSRSIKFRKCEELFASQEGLSSAEFVTETIWEQLMRRRNEENVVGSCHGLF